MSSWYARITAPAGYLVYGLKTVTSSRYQHRSQAKDWALAMLEGLGPDRLWRCDVECTEVETFPELFVHCGEDLTVIGGRCPRCGEIMTVARAKEAGREKT